MVLSSNDMKQVPLSPLWGTRLCKLCPKNTRQRARNQYCPRSPWSWMFPQYWFTMFSTVSLSGGNHRGGGGTLLSYVRASSGDGEERHSSNITKSHSKSEGTSNWRQQCLRSFTVDTQFWGFKREVWDWEAEAGAGPSMWADSNHTVAIFTEPGPALWCQPTADFSPLSAENGSQEQHSCDPQEKYKQTSFGCTSPLSKGDVIMLILCCWLFSLLEALTWEGYTLPLPGWPPPERDIMQDKA